MLLTRSPIETMPIGFSPSNTGRWRTRFSLMTAIQSSTDCSECGITSYWMLSAVKYRWSVGLAAAYKPRITCSHGSRGRERPGSPPHSGVLSADGVVLVEDSDLARPPSDKDARWHDRAPAERQRDRRRTVANRSPAVPQQSSPTRPWQMDFSSRPAATAGLRLSQFHAGRASTEATQHRRTGPRRRTASRLHTHHYGATILTV